MLNALTNLFIRVLAPLFPRFFDKKLGILPDDIFNLSRIYRIEYRLDTASVRRQAEIILLYFHIRFLQLYPYSITSFPFAIECSFDFDYSTRIL